MVGKFYTIDYIPNNLAYVYEVTKKEIKFLAFFNDDGKGMRAVKHSVDRESSKRDFSKPKKDFRTTARIQEMIDEVLTSH